MKPSNSFTNSTKLNTNNAAQITPATAKCLKLRPEGGCKWSLSLPSAGSTRTIVRIA